MVGAAFITRIASRVLGWPVQLAFIAAHEGTGTGLGGGRGEGEMVGRALGDSLGVEVATTDGLGLAVAVGEEPHAANTIITAIAPTPRPIPR